MGRKPKTYSITVHEARGLVGAKGEAGPLSSSVSFTLLDNAPAESEVVAESNTPAYAFSSPVEVPTDDASLSRLVAAPLAISVVESSRAAGKG